MALEVLRHQLVLLVLLDLEAQEPCCLHLLVLLDLEHLLVQSYLEAQALYYLLQLHLLALLVLLVLELQLRL